MTGQAPVLSRFTTTAPVAQVQQTLAALRAMAPPGAAGLAALLKDPGSGMLALDFDGTLADIVPDPEKVRLRADAARSLSALSDRIGHVVIVTGRPVRALAGPKGFLGPHLARRIHVLGLYGAERWDPATGRAQVPGPSLALAKARAELPGLLAPLAADADVWIEEKGGAVAVHTRRAAAPQGVFARIEGPLARLAERHGLRAEPGRFVVELRPENGDKGTALRTFLRKRDVSGAVLYAGDDRGDIPAFDTLRARRRAAPATLLYSKPAGPGETVTQLARRADAQVPGPAGVASVLALLARAVHSREEASRIARILAVAQ